MSDEAIELATKEELTVRANDARHRLLTAVEAIDHKARAVVRVGRKARRLALPIAAAVLGGALVLGLLARFLMRRASR